MIPQVYQKHKVVQSTIKPIIKVKKIPIPRYCLTNHQIKMEWIEIKG